MVGIKPSFWLQVHSLMQVYQKQLLHGDGQAYLSAKHMENVQAILMNLSCCTSALSNNNLMVAQFICNSVGEQDLSYKQAECKVLSQLGLI